MNLEILIIIVSAMYMLLYSLIILNLIPKKSQEKKESGDEKSNINCFSIIVAAKNEVKNLSRLISSLRNLNYPTDKFEVIISDDCSEDATYIEAKELSKDLNNFKIVKAEAKSFEGKRGALDFGISLATFPNIMITDADCVPEANWLRDYTEKFKRGYDFVFGIAPYFQTDRIVNKISCFENFRNFILSFSALNLNLPYTASARNFGFRKAAFQSAGGYKNTIETMSGDDDLLLREAIKNNLKIGAVTDPGSFVFSHSKETFKEYFIQRARHTQTSFHYLFKQKLFLLTWHLLNISFILSPLLSIIDIYFLIPFAIKIIFDLLTGVFYQKKFEYEFSTIEILYLQFLYEIFLIVHFFRAKFGRITWK